MVNGRGGQTEAELVTALESLGLISHISAANMSWLSGSSFWAPALPTPLVFTPAVQELPFAGARHGKEIPAKHLRTTRQCTGRGCLNKKILQLHWAQQALEWYRFTCFSVFSPCSSLKGQYAIPIIVRYNLMKNWCVRLEWCYFIWGRASHHISPPCLLIPSPFYQLLFTKPGGPRVYVSACESPPPKCTTTL